MGAGWGWPAWRRRWVVNGALEALGWIGNSEKRKTFWLGEMLGVRHGEVWKVHLGGPGVHTEACGSSMRTILFLEAAYLC